MKLAFILVEVVLAIVFGVMTFRKSRNVAAVVEWVISLIFTFWVLSFAVDLWPAVKGLQEEVEAAEEGRVRGVEGDGMVEMGEVRKSGVAGSGVVDGVNGVNGVAYGNGHTHVSDNF